MWCGPPGCTGHTGPISSATMTGLEAAAADRRRRRRPAGASPRGPSTSPSQIVALVARGAPPASTTRPARADDLVRPGPRGLPAARRRPGPGTAGHEQRAFPARRRARPTACSATTAAAAGVQPIGDWRTALEPGLAAHCRHGRWAHQPRSRAAWARCTRRSPGAARRRAPAPATGRAVLARQDRLDIVGPGDGDLGVKWVHAVLVGGLVRGGAQVHYGGFARCAAEGVPQSLGQEYSAPRPRRPAGRPPSGRSWATRPEVDDDVEDRTADARDVLRLAGRDVSEMNAPDDPAAGHRTVGLRHGSGTRRGGQLGA